MQLDWLTNPITHYAMLAAGLSACLCLFVTVQARVAVVGKRCRRNQASAGTAIEELKSGLESLRNDLREIEHRAQIAEAASIPPAPHAVNLNKRTLVLRMARHGERPDQISAALRMPQHEVDLILKVHRSVMRLT